MSQPNEVVGMDGSTTSDSEFNATSFLVRQMLLGLKTVDLVRVMKCTNDGGLSPVGFVDVQPLVNQMSGDRKATPHATIYNIPYFRLQGGKNAIIIDPEVGDIGMCAFASRDISSVKVNKAPSNPASHRTFDWADGLYFGGFLNGVPSQFIRYHGGGIEVKTPGQFKVDAGSIDLGASGAVTINGSTIDLN